MLTVMAGWQIWPCPVMLATGWGAAEIEKPRWRPHPLIDPQTLRGSVEVVPWTSGADLAVQLGARGIESAPAVAALNISAPVQSLVILRVTPLAPLAHAIQAGEDVPVFGLEIEFPTSPSFVPILPAIEPGVPRSIQVVTEGFAQRLGTPNTAFRSDHVLGALDEARSPSVPERYTALWASSPIAPSDAHLWLAPDARGLTELAAAWSTSPLRDALDICTGLLTLLALSGCASPVVQCVYPLARTSRRQALLLGLANLMTFVGTCVAVSGYAKRRNISLERGARFALFSSVTFTAAVALLAALTTLIHP